MIRRSLKGETFVPSGAAFTVLRSQPTGHVEAVCRMMARLGLPALIASKPCAERDLVLAMIASRILDPQTKLALTRSWQATTLADTFGVAEADEQDCYAATDWLGARQGRIQKKLATRHLKTDGLVLYDLSSSYFEGTTCPLARLGYSRDGRRGTLQVNYGLLTDDRGCPVAVSVHEGNTADPTTLMPEMTRIKEDFGIAALKSTSIRALVEDQSLQPDLFDETNLCEIAHPDYPGERLVACRNPELAKLRRHKREDLLGATEEALRPDTMMRPSVNVTCSLRRCGSVSQPAA